MSEPENVECPSCDGEGFLAAPCADGETRRFECFDCDGTGQVTPENVEELAEADIAAGNLGEPMTTEQMREAMSKLRRLGDRSTPENVECQTCDDEGIICVNFDINSHDPANIAPCPDCTPENVESPLARASREVSEQQDALAENVECRRCGAATDPIFHHESGGLCGYCLADDGLPLTVIKPDNVEEPT